MRSDARARVAAIAHDQHGPFSRRQALEVGVSRKALERDVRDGVLVRMLSGVYLAAPVPITWRQRLSAALLACGPDAVAAHRAAAAVWDLAMDLFVAEVTIPERVKRRHRGLVIHRSGAIDPTRREGFPVTKPARTLIDLSGCVPEQRLARMVDDAHRRRIVDLRRLARDLELPVHRNRRGTGVLREIVAARDAARPVGSDLESIFFEALRGCGLPLPVPQYAVMTIHGRRFIDFAYPDRMIAIELDGWEEHGTRRAFEADRARQNDVERLGYHFQRFTWTQVVADPTGVAAQLGLMLGLTPIRWTGAKGSAARRRRRRSAARGNITSL